MPPIKIETNQVSTTKENIMDLSNYKTMDPTMLVGVINTTLRNHCDSLKDLCLSYDLNQDILIDRLASADYIYKSELNQFR